MITLKHSTRVWSKTVKGREKEREWKKTMFIGPCIIVEFEE